MMSDKEFIIKLMYRAFLDIRLASYDGNVKVIFLLSDIFHTIPLQLLRADKGEISYTDIIISIQKKCDANKCAGWLKNATSDISNV